MCGIAGGVIVSGISKEFIQDLLHNLIHRGPDSGGVFISNDGKFGLGHRRLSILDLSDVANQPMESACGRYVIVFNGEVYNYKELASAYNLNCRTQSDTEVILAVLSKKGIRAIEEFNGMFAFAIFDKIENKLILVRDRLGIKPIYYFKDGTTFLFASELKSLEKHPWLKNKLEVNPQAISSFLHLGYIPRPHSIYKQIKKFPQGHFAIIDTKGNFDLQPYWKLEDKISSSFEQNEKSALEQMGYLLKDSVKLRLRSDAPFGAFLSGGVDSSLIAAIASKELSGPLKTFSIGFENQNYNEVHYARKVADFLGSNHHEYILEENEAIGLIDQMIPTYDEPFGDSSGIPTMLVSKLASTKVKMVLTGDGGDELFLGYGMYNWAKRLQNPFIKAFEKPIHHALKAVPTERYRRVAELFRFPVEGMHQHVFSQEQNLFSIRELKYLLEPYVLQEEVFSYKEPMINRILEAEEAQAFFDFQYYLPDDLLVKVDRASMKYGLECRVPLLDYRIIEFSLNLSPKLKVKGETKYLLKKLLYTHLPKEIFDRKKGGFSIPLADWMKGSLKEQIMMVLSQSVLKDAGWVNPIYVMELLKKFYSGTNFLYNRIWVLYQLHLWYLVNLKK